MESLFYRYLSEAKDKFAIYKRETATAVSFNKSRPALSNVFRLRNEITVIKCHLVSINEFFAIRKEGLEVEGYIEKYTALLAMLNAYLDG